MAGAQVNPNNNDNLLIDAIIDGIVVNEGDRNYLKEHNKEELYFLKRALLNQIFVRKKIGSPHSFVSNIINDIGNYIDFIYTFIRLSQVFPYAVANHGNNDNPNSASWFNKEYYNHGNPQDGFTAFGYGLFVFSLLAAILSATVKFIQLKNQLKQESFDYLAEQIKKYNNEKADEELTQQAIDAECVRLIKAKFKKEKDYNDAMAQPAANPADMGEPEVETKLQRLNKALTNSFAATMVNTVWGYINNPTFVFWLVFMPITGIAAIAFPGFIATTALSAVAAAVLGPLVLGLPLAIGVFIPLWEMFKDLKVERPGLKAALISGLILTALIAVPIVLTFAAPYLLPVVGSWVIAAGFVLAVGAAVASISVKIHQHRQAKSEEKNDLMAAEKAASEKAHSEKMMGEIKHHVHAAKVRKFMREDHHLQLKKLGIDKALGEVKRVKSLKALKKAKDAKDAKYNDGGIREYVLGSIHERRFRLVLTAALSFLFNVVIVAFIGWFGSAVLGALAGALPIMGVIGSIVGNSAVGALAGIMVGGIFGFRDVVKLYNDQKGYEKKVDTTLNAPYKRLQDNHDYIADLGLTNEQAFDLLDKEVKRKQQALMPFRDLIKDKENGLDIKRIDVRNHRFFRKFQPDITGYGWFKKVLTWVRAFLGGGQTGAFLARFLFLKGGVFAGAAGIIGITALTGGLALWTFIGLAIGFAVVYGVMSVISYQLARNQYYREFMIENIEEHICYLKKADKTLDQIAARYNSDLISSSEDRDNRKEEVSVTEDTHTSQEKEKLADTPAAAGFSSSHFGDSTDSTRSTASTDDSASDALASSELSVEVSAKYLPGQSMFASISRKAQVIEADVQKAPAASATTKPDLFVSTGRKAHMIKVVAPEASVVTIPSAGASAA